MMLYIWVQYKYREPETVVVVAFQSIFYLEMYKKMFFKKIYF